MTDPLPAAYLTPGSASFVEFVRGHRPDLLPTAPAGGVVDAPHGTTIVALAVDGAVVMAGDRRAMMGTTIASKDMHKVFAAGHNALVGVAGTAGIAVELVRLYQMELEHYEKIEGTPLSLRGKANRLGGMLRGNLALAMQGLSVLPVLAGVDASGPRVFSYDVTGGCFEEPHFHTVGSGSVFARGALKKLWRPGLGVADGVRVAVTALYDAADDDSATGGPDPGRHIYPTVAVATVDEVRFVPAGDVATAVTDVVALRIADPGGER